MAPGQHVMDIDSNSKAHSCIKFEPDEKRIFSFQQDGEGRRFLRNHEKTDVTVEAEFYEKMKQAEISDAEDVDITSHAGASEKRLYELEDPDATEYSSSFDGTISNTEDYSGLSEAEAESRFFSGNSLASAFDTLNNPFPVRKKKMTAHWKNFIRPLMWRCKWTELRIKEIESRASKYSKQLAAYDQAKHPGVDMHASDGLCSKSLQYSAQCYNRRVMKRRKRKRIEETTDVSSYMSCHHLFSYLENRRSDPDGTFMVDDLNNLVARDQNGDSTYDFDINNDQSMSDVRDGDHSLEQVLYKIESIHSRVHKLKSQLDVLMSKHALKFSSENLSLLGQTSSDPTPALSAGNGETLSVAAIYASVRHKEIYLGNIVMPESAFSRYEDYPIPDVIESTVGMLSAADVTPHQPQTGDSDEAILDNIHIQKEVAEGESHSFKIKPEENRDEQDESTGPPLLPLPAPHQEAKAIKPHEQSTLRSCLASDFHFPKNKRKKCERKAGSGGWSKKPSGEPDSQ